MKVDLFITGTIKDETGKTIKTKKRKANSLVRAFIFLVGVQMKQSALASQTKDTSGTLQTLDVTSAVNLALTIPNVGDDTTNILVGTGSATPTIEDFQMGALINNGVGAGQLSYATTSITDPGVVGSTASVTVTRTMQNNSGGTINVSEVGLVLLGRAGGLNKKFLVDRTLFSISVPTGKTLTITYSINVTV